MTPKDQLQVLSDGQVLEIFDQHKSVPGPALRLAIGRAIESATLTALAQQAREPVARIETPMYQEGGCRYRAEVTLTKELPLYASLYTTPQPAQVATVQGDGDAALIEAANAYAKNYDDDARQDIKTDVMNAFFHGSAWQKALPPAQPAQAGEVTYEQIEDLAWLDVDEHREIDRSSDHNKMMTAPQRCAFKRGARAILALRPQAAVPVDAFAEGWRMAADWANRDDLLPDMDSPQYTKERDERLADLRPQAAIPEVDVHKDGDGDAHVCLSLGNGSFFDCAVSPSGSVAWAFRIGVHTAHKKEQVDWRPQAVPMTPEQVAVLRFCWGSGTLDGLGFGDKHPELPGSFWWRNHLAEAFPGITAKAEVTHQPTKEAKT